MKSQWDELTDKLQELREPLEDMLEMLPFGKKYFRMKQKIEKAWREVGRACDKLDPFISDNINAIPVESPWASDEFKSTWQLYKEYMKEQHGIVMQSRMELLRLEWLKENSDNDPQKAIFYIKFWIARGSDSIYKVKIDKEESKNNETGAKRAAFALPTAKETAN